MEVHFATLSFNFYGIVEWLMHHTNVGLQFPKSVFHHVYKKTIHVDQLLH